MSTSNHPRRLRDAAALLALVASVALVGCDDGAPPPTNPLDESRVTATAAATPTGPAVFPPTPATAASTGTPPASGSGVTGDAAQEKAAARAIEAMAGWLGRPQSEFTIVLVETVAWRDACLDVARPDVACAQVVTPGERVTVRHRSDRSYTVHLGPREAAAWAPIFNSTRTIERVDLASGLVTLRALTGSDELGTRHRTVPGSIVPEFKDLKPGDRVRIAAVPWPSTDADAAAIVWLVRVP